MKKYLLIICILFISAVATSAQCPENLVCLTKEQATEMLRANDEGKAAIESAKLLRQAIEKLETDSTELRIKYAQLTGEKTQLEASLIRANAIIDILVRNSRPKKIGIINL